MSRLTKLTWLLVAFILFGLVACGGGTPTTDPSLAFTQIWQTVEAAQAQTALASSATPSFTNTPATPESLQATNTPLITNTLLPGVPSATPHTISTPTGAQPAACDNANFVSDVTIPDGSEELAGSTFVKTWRFKNLGPCIWTTSYHLVFSYVSDSGKNGAFTPPAPVSFPKTVSPGEEVDISVTLTAPTKAGTYQAVFVLQNDKGYNIPHEGIYEFFVNFVVK
ncbi:MAG: NBR1-Ig-like domain-containing protein [Chloroflexi bacterium]|nr:NBR1-Ig-like domain-containing protein [Chloroflexota bacterium]